ncbi:unnamed protein product [Cyprideis torosa]|uniref:Uncharacterized protein n=1 Tax=Cyprideis torosa TaxID=163714 RepID=A0A7R8WN63_9CRUS|nr:unnamed protein product [Cyprideis torosa]CAG0900064.1 unnamed protein product [Cyprideis torosa]
MNSEVEKEPSDFEVPRADDGYALPKFDGVEVSNDHHEFSESGETVPRTDVLPRCMYNKKQTGGAPDQIEPTRFFKKLGYLLQFDGSPISSMDDWMTQNLHSLSEEDRATTDVMLRCLFTLSTLWT